MFLTVKDAEFAAKIMTADIRCKPFGSKLVTPIRGICNCKNYSSDLYSLSNPFLWKPKSEAYRFMAANNEQKPYPSILLNPPVFKELQRVNNLPKWMAAV